MPDPFISPKARILIIDDEADIRESLETLLSLEGFQVALAPNADEGERALRDHGADLILLDLMMPGRSGIELLPALRALDPLVPVFLLTAYGSIETAVQALKSGASDYFTKPWDNHKLLLEIDRAIAQRRLQDQLDELRRALKERYSFSNLVGKSERMLKLIELLHQVTPSRAAVLLTGEPGTGKEFVAKAIHAESPRASGPFVSVTTSAMTPDLIDDALFGASSRAAAAHSGTLFLDEVAALNLESQAKLLSLIQDRRLPSGLAADVRLLAATTQDLRRLLAESRFREDLFYKLSVITVPLPALRERREDIPALADAFAGLYAREHAKPPLAFDPEALRILIDHSWPGNVGELENVVERAVILATGPLLTADLLPEHLLHAGGVWTRTDPAAEVPPDASLHERVIDFERRIILEALDRLNGSQTEAAELLKVPLSTLNQKIKRLQIEIKRR
jgi:DNA-binding NtrC family response regulator